MAGLAVLNVFITQSLTTVSIEGLSVTRTAETDIFIRILKVDGKDTVLIKIKVSHMHYLDPNLSKQRA